MTVDRLLKWIVMTLSEAGWAPFLILLLHAFAVVAVDAYRRFASLDVLMHFAGGVAIAWFLHRASINASRCRVIGPFHPVTHGVLVGSLVCVAALVWEFAEFFLDQSLGTHYQPGLDDTMTDLLVGIAGGSFLLAGVGFLGHIRRAANERSE
ncbi:MAG: hypothetical protein WBC44_22305 [Planctomycetaceae bacterium]